MDPRTLRDLSNDDLRTKISDLEPSSGALAGEIAKLDARVSSIRAEWSRQTTHMNTIKNELERRLTPAPEPRISDHALLRYIERVLNIDVDELRSEILTKSVVQAIQAGATAVTVNGVKFVVNGVTIVTTLGEEQRLKRKTVRNGRTVDLSEKDAIAEGLAEAGQ